MIAVLLTFAVMCQSQSFSSTTFVGMGTYSITTTSNIVVSHNGRTDFVLPHYAGLARYPDRPDSDSPGWRDLAEHYKDTLGPRYVHVWQNRRGQIGYEAGWRTGNCRQTLFSIVAEPDGSVVAHNFLCSDLCTPSGEPKTVWIMHRLVILLAEVQEAQASIPPLMERLQKEASKTVANYWAVSKLPFSVSDITGADYYAVGAIVLNNKAGSCPEFVITLGRKSENEWAHATFNLSTGKIVSPEPWREWLVSTLTRENIPEAHRQFLRQVLTTLVPLPSE